MWPDPYAWKLVQVRARSSNLPTQEWQEGA